jgi:hypothetical protein
LAAADPEQGQQAAAQRAMAFERLDRVVRAAWVEAAARTEEGADDALVGTYQTDRSTTRKT